MYIESLSLSLSLLTFAHWTAGVWEDCRVATEQRGTGMSLTQNAPVMTQALGTVVQVPRLPLHKVPAVQRLTHLMSPLGQGYNHISCDDKLSETSEQ